MLSEKEFRNEDAVLDIKDRPQAFHWVGLSLQHLFTMFGATVLVPILVGIDPGIALVSSGLGTMVYLITTKGKIPAYLGSSFAFIAAMQMLMKSDGYPAIAQGAMTTGLVYLIVSLIIKKIGSDWLDKILPPIVVGPVVMVIGLGLAANAANNAMYNNNVYDFKYIAVALITLGLTIFYNMFFKGFLGLIPILLGIVSGYLVALAFGIIDLTPIKEAAWFLLFLRRFVYGKSSFCMPQVLELWCSRTYWSISFSSLLVNFDNPSFKRSWRNWSAPSRVVASYLAT